MITEDERNIDFPIEIIKQCIYAAMVRTEYMVTKVIPKITPYLPEKLYIIHRELRQLYPKPNS